jgi:hypothetical protein
MAEQRLPDDLFETVPDHLFETMRRLEKLAEERPTDAWLQERIKEAREILAILIGYLIG